MTAPLKASILIATYNRRPILMETLQSLAAQTVSPDRYQVVVAVDGATDDTKEALADFEAPYELTWFRQENQGITTAFNNAALRARHEVIINLGDDQRASPELVAAHLDAHERWGNVLVQGFYPIAPGYDRRGSSMLYDRWIRTALSQLEGKPPHEWHIWSGNISMRREVWRQVGGYDDAMREYGCEDTDLGFRVAALGVKFVYEPRALSYHMHVCGYRAMRRQAYEGGRSFVRLARKYELPLTEFPGIATEGRVQRAVRESWRVAPAFTEQVGRGLTGALWAADVSQWRGAQMLAARAVHRFYKIRGVLDEVKRRAPVTPAADRKPVTRPSHGGG